MPVRKIVGGFRGCIRVKMGSTTHGEVTFIHNFLWIRRFHSKKSRNVNDRREPHKTSCCILERIPTTWNVFYKCRIAYLEELDHWKGFSEGVLFSVSVPIKHKHKRKLLFQIHTSCSVVVIWVYWLPEWMGVLTLIKPPPSQHPIRGYVPRPMWTGAMKASPFSYLYWVWWKETGNYIRTWWRMGCYGNSPRKHIFPDLKLQRRSPPRRDDVSLEPDKQSRDGTRSWVSWGRHFSDWGVSVNILGVGKGLLNVEATFKIMSVQVQELEDRDVPKLIWLIVIKLIRARTQAFWLAAYCWVALTSHNLKDLCTLL